ncbi:MAG: FKBP-type peptidyl-prolyl cis-trans isomerase [Prevotellaceae bacterium]|jgi:FKBP-type peptidyl-prolyl cis-trans isomerase|nr:FKBP-type peptidyl-prolyl cis-trans isomerase [Prevotellaceae bacterium]
MKMIRTGILTAALCGMVSISCTSSGLSAKSSELDSVSYAFGINIGQSLSNVKIEGLNVDAIASGIRDVLNNKGENAKLTNEESIAIIEAFFKKMQDETLARNLKEGQEFLEKNKGEEGVITTESGLQYKVITQGEGPKPAETDEVEVNYRGTLLSGDEFDSSYERGQPAKFKLNQVIKGWTEGLQLVNEGSKVQFWIPSELAYGEQGGGRIEPNSTLIFEVELLKVTKTEAEKK